MRYSGNQTTVTDQVGNGRTLADSLTSETFPSGRVVTTKYDFMNRVNGVTGLFNNANTNYVTTGVAYAPHGAPSQYSYGNTLYRNYTYNSRLQPRTGNDSVLNNPGNTHLYFTWN
jgi:hypothetical protein